MQLAPVRHRLPLAAVLCVVSIVSFLAAAPAWAHFGSAIGQRVLPIGAAAIAGIGITLVLAL